MFADINGIRMSYEDRGSGEPMVLIGGFGANGAFWSNAVPMMDGYRVITFDNRGVGTPGMRGVSPWRIWPTTSWLSSTIWGWTGCTSSDGPWDPRSHSSWGYIIRTG